MFWLGKSKKARYGEKEVGLSPIEYIILTHLRSRELKGQKEVGQYGYELIKELNQIFAGSWEAKSGTIYPILTKLDKDKELLSGEKKVTPLGPVKKVYVLTKMGRGIIDQIIIENYANDMKFVDNYMNLLGIFKEHFEKEIENQKRLKERESAGGISCPNCEFVVAFDALFCSKCGTKIDD